MQTDFEAGQTLIGEIKRFLKTSEWLTPVNLAEAKDDFFKSQTSNPQLIYPEIPANQLKGYWHQLKEIEMSEAKALEQRMSSRSGRKIAR
ncbi:hypothetical protein A2W24_01225 [Microgenomates group bacterium RBG_16_45_19]|nr:MAG: hypothetical protein A2W24_01225 [Microgenomates group bacterium RBG_16_45_19]